MEKERSCSDFDRCTFCVVLIVLHIMQVQSNKTLYISYSVHRFPKSMYFIKVPAIILFCLFLFASGRKFNAWILCVCVCLSAARSLALPANMNFFKRCRFFVLDSSISSSSLPLFIMPFYSLLLLAFRCVPCICSTLIELNTAITNRSERE